MAPSQPSEVDILLNRVNVSLARSKKLVASWLPPPTAEELASAKTEDEIEREENEIFQPTPDRLGLGAAVPSDVNDGSFARDKLASNANLRKHLLGHKALRATTGAQLGQKYGIQQTKIGSKPLASRTLQKDRDSEDEDEGRTAILKSKRSKPQPAKPTPNQNGTETNSGSKPPADTSEDTIRENDGTEKLKPSKAVHESKRKRPTNYLDELLSGRGKASKKKRK